MTEDQIHKHINEESSSIEMSTPSKGGALKVYFDPNKPEEAKQKIKNAIELRKWMQEQMEIQ